MKALPATLRALAPLILLPAAAFSGQFTGQVNTLGGYDSNPAGFSGSAAQALGWSRMKLGWQTALDESELSLEYTGSVYSFAPQSDWTAHAHAVRASYSAYAAPDLLMGMSGKIGGNWNRPAYSAYSYYELSWAGWLRSYTNRDWPIEARLELGSRAYTESKEFDFRRVGLSVSARHRWPTRTSLRVSGGYARRSYPTVTIDDLIAGRTQGRSHQYRLNAALAQGLTTTTGLRLTGWAVKGDGESRWREEYWQALDDPLARTGVGGRIQLSWLAPAALTVRTYVGARRIREKYITADAEQGNRLDRVAETGVVVEGALPWTPAERPLSWSVELNTAKQTSDDADYTYGHTSILFGIKYAW